MIKKLSLLFILLITVALTSACLWLEYRPLAPLPDIMQTQAVAISTETSPKNRPKVALALGGGAAKGFAHIGVIKILDQAGIPIDIVTGTSAGAVVGSLYASGANGQQIHQLALKLDENALADLRLNINGPIKGDRLAEFINQQVGSRPIESLNKSFAAVATDFQTGNMHVFTKGDAGQAVRASSSIPNLFQMAIIDQRQYVDGGLVAPVPVQAALDLGADFVIAIDISARPYEDLRENSIRTADQSVKIMYATVLKNELGKANFTISPDVEKLSPIGFKQRHEAILLGEEATLKALPELIKALDKAGIQPQKH